MEAPMTELKKAIVELLSYYPADDVLAEIRRALDDTRIPLEQTEAALRGRLALGLDSLLKDNE
jgi:hypothetical protein